MQLKPGVRILGIRPEVILALAVADEVWQKQGSDLVITAIVDGVHKRSSAHYTGCAADLRSSTLTDPEKARAELQAALGDDFDVIFEGAGTPNAHIHCEFDPKLAY